MRSYKAGEMPREEGGVRSGSCTHALCLEVGGKKGVY